MSPLQESSSWWLHVVENRGQAHLLGSNPISSSCVVLCRSVNLSVPQFTHPLHESF